LAIEPTPVGPILPAWSPDCVELGLWRLKMCSSPLPHSHLAVATPLGPPLTKEPSMQSFSSAKAAWILRTSTATNSADLEPVA
jgi:hypothetical protein